MGIKNKVQLIGNVGREPSTTGLENGKKLARIGSATHEHLKNGKGERKVNTH